MTSPLPDHPPRPARAGRPARVPELARTFWRGSTSTQGLGAALEEVLRGSTGTSAPRTSVWLHDRRDRSLSLSPRRPGAHGGSGQRVAADDPDAPAARGLRLDRPQILASRRTGEPGGRPVLITPLRGWRRALGTLVVEGTRRMNPTPASGSIWPATSGVSSRTASRTSSCSRRCSASGACSRTRSTRSSTSWW